MASPTFENKVVLITGASNGIGAATAAQFAALGAKIAGLDIRDSEIPSTDKRIDIKCDVSDEDSVIAAVKAVVEKWGTIDVLCNIAGIADKFRKYHYYFRYSVYEEDQADIKSSKTERVTETTNADLNRIMGINFNGPLFLMRHVIPHFLAKPGSIQGQGYNTVLPKKGAIVNICSAAALRGSAAGAIYTSSKHALLGLTRNTACMDAKEGVRTNAVLPGGVATNILNNSGIDPSTQLDPIGFPILQPAHALQPAVCVPDDVARTIVFLAGADGVNGAEVTVDQGWCQA
ncbi:hypothetical protein LTS08_004831 [Lithohypha guttulata]|nr:hypothetical protein LTS08_004831 [Lithohypha guttulata]